MAAFLKSTCDLLVPPIEEAFTASVVGCRSEVAFFRRLIWELKNRLDAIELPLAKFSCRIAEIHQKPIVQTEAFRCELGDLLIVVKYHTMDGLTQAKSVIYQAKMSDAKRKQCRIDQNQLTLLRTWPTFRFGRRADGEAREYSLSPSVLEFGSYMLEPRNARIEDVLLAWPPDAPLEYGSISGRWRRSYGLCPTAWDCYWAQTESVKLSKASYLVPDVDAVLGQILFSKGEHHCSREIAEFVEALYRYVGLSPDPPAEFDGYSKESYKDGFGVLEINVEQRPNMYEHEQEYRKEKCMGKSEEDFRAWLQGKKFRAG